MMHFWAVKKKLMEAYRRDNPKATKKQLLRFNKYITPQRIDKLETGLEKAFHVKLKDTDKDGTPDIVDCQPLNPSAQDTTHEVGDAFWQGMKAKGSSVTSEGDKLYSYGTVILQRLADGRVVGNKTKYSTTTSKHQSQVGVGRADVFADDVPMDTDDLSSFVGGTPTKYPSGSKVFPVKEGVDIVAHYEKTPSGFRHVAVLMKDGEEIGRAKVSYLNRTWESYEFETVIQDLLAKDKALTKAEKEQALSKASEQSAKELEQKFGTIASVAKLGEIFGTTPKEKTDWKKRMLKAGLPALDFPEDWDTLSEETKEARLNAVISHLQKKGG
jgi:hypothetical protein